ncbi:MAG: ATP-binding protein [Spirochaetaceae bacterium]|jgi:energy-coupling factor transporter ATP-binding protein EcfA2|nr:ATP-binding protein [Spirochaetaceae bacterium]
MILRKLTYCEFDGRPTQWSLEGLSLGKINLLVGKNATGKTNTITKINWLASMLAGLQPQLLNSASYETEFSDETDTYNYTLKLEKNCVVLEKLSINGEEKFIRDNQGTGHIVAAQFPEQPMNFKLSPNQLVIVSKRDAIQHPYLEKLSEWAGGQRMYAFSSKLGQDTVFSTNDMNNFVVNPRDMNSVVPLYVKGEHEFPNDFRKKVIAAMKNIGYDLTNIGVISNPAISPASVKSMTHIADSSSFLMLYVGEKDIQTPVFQQGMSQGMFRALSLVIQVIYNVLKKVSTTVLIDDIGEGLDYERSTNTIQSLMDLAQNNDIQLIMSTNDRFVMNNIPLDYWQVIQRKGGNCNIYNYENSKKKFDEFKFTGLSNFDFLKTDFLNAEWNDEESSNIR